MGWDKIGSGDKPQLATVLDDLMPLEVCNQLIRDMVSDKVLASLGPAQHYPTRMLVPLLLLHLFTNAVTGMKQQSGFCHPQKCTVHILINQHGIQKRHY